MMRENQNHVILQKFYLEIKLCVLGLLVFLPLLLEIWDISLQIILFSMVLMNHLLLELKMKNII